MGNRNVRMLDSINVGMSGYVRLNFDNYFLATGMICFDMCYKHIALHGMQFSLQFWMIDPCQNQTALKYETITCISQIADTHFFLTCAMGFTFTVLTPGTRVHLSTITEGSTITCTTIFTLI